MGSDGGWTNRHLNGVPPMGAKGLRSLADLTLVFLLLAQSSLAQTALPVGPLSLPEPASVAKPEALNPLQDIDAERARVESHIEESQKQLAEAQQTLQGPNAPAGDDERQALEQRIALLESRLLVARRYLETLDEAGTIRDERRQLQGQLDTSADLPSPPPYPIDLVESLARKLRSQKAAIETDEMRLAASTHGKTLMSAELDSDEKRFRQTLETLEGAETDAARQAARRDHALSELALSLSSESVAFLRAGEQLVKERLALHRLRAERSRSQLAQALKDLRLTPEDVQTRTAILDRELAAARKTRAKIARAEDAASDQLAELHERIDTQEQQGKVEPLAGLELELRQAQIESIRATLEDIDLQIGYLQALRRLWSERLALHRNWEVVTAKEALKDIETLLKPFAQGISALKLDQEETASFEVEQRFERPELAESRTALVEAMKERSAQLGPTLRGARQLQEFLDLWKREIEVRIGDQGTAEQTRAWGDVVLDRLKGFWSYEILAVEDTLTVNGEKIVEKRPVTVGKTIEAALILTIGLLAASGLARPISRIVLPYSAQRWQRRLLIQKILRVAMIALVVVLALVTVKIPLTVFAFLGGAIALGIGFGAKNLLNNFISGFILLGEGTIRPGDRIEIEGNLGIVQRIGERSTQVRRLDGVELLIPNSHFLENRVTNLTLSDRRLRVAIQVGVAYGSPTRQVEALLLEIAHANPLVVATPAPVAVFEDFGDSALVFRLYVWVDLAAQPDHRAVITELRHCIAERFAEAGFAIAFPQMDLHFDTKGPIPIRVSKMDGECTASGESRLSPSSSTPTDLT